MISAECRVETPRQRKAVPEEEAMNPNTQALGREGGRLEGEERAGEAAKVQKAGQKRRDAKAPREEGRRNAAHALNL